MNPTSFRLLPSLQFTPHVSNRGRWYAVEDPQTGRFIKLGPAEYLVASGLQNGVAAQQIVEVLVRHGFDNAKERVTATVTWLAKQGLLIQDSPRSETVESTSGSSQPTPAGTTTSTPDVTGSSTLASPSNVATTNATQASRRATSGGEGRPMSPTAARQKKTTSSFQFDPFFIRMPVLSGPVAERLARPFTWMVSWPCGIGLVVLLTMALAVLAGSSERFWSLNEKLFVEDGRLWWLVAWFVLKCCHEMGHAVAAISTGSRIRSAGLHFIFLAPVPYVDVTDLWRVTNGRQRVLVSAAGMLAEMAVAAVAVLVALASTNLQLQYMCAAMATLGTVTTIAFNGNPLMKFDGYYILSDYLSRPNLWTEAQAAAKGTLSRLINPFASSSAHMHYASGIDSQGGQLGLAAFGLTTMFYRVLMLVGLAWWLITVWHGVGLLVIAWAVWGWFVRPIWLKRASIKSAQAAGLMPPGSASRTMSRAQWIYSTALLMTCTVVAFLPAPHGVTAPGIVGYGNPTTVRAAAEGVLRSVQVSDRQMIQQGDLIGQLENPQLLVELTDAQLKYQASQEQANALRARGELALLQAEQAKMESLAVHVQQLSDKVANLEVRAPCSGMLLMSLAEKTEGRFIKQGMALCMIVSPHALEVVASASQRDASRFSHQVGKTVTIAATGSRGSIGKLVSVDTRGTEHCQQEALAARYGGPVAVEFTSNEHGEQVLKFSGPRFEVKADLEMNASNGPQWLPGQLVWVHLNDQHPKVWQWVWNMVLGEQA